MAVKHVQVEGIGDVALYKRRGQRTIRLSVRPDGEIRVTLPMFASYQSAIDFVTSRRGWLALHKPKPNQFLRPDQSIGTSYTLKFMTGQAIDKLSSRVTDSDILIRYPKSKQYTDDDVQQAAQRAAVKALRREAEETLPSRVAHLGERTGFTYSSVIVKKLKGRWGSCDQNHNIVLNLYLMQLPDELIDYVIIHELVHTKHLHHGETFWAEFLHHEPKAKQLRRAMRAYAPQVMTTTE